MTDREKVEIILPVVRQIIAEHDDKAAQARKKPALVGWFVGRAMQKLRGQFFGNDVVAIVCHELGISP